MEEYIKLFQNHTQYEAYKNSADFVTPNVSYCEQQDEVHYNPWEDPRLICKFNITDTTNATYIIGPSASSQFSEIEIDGVVQPSVDIRYQFDTTGEHIIKYTLVDNTSIGNNAFHGCNSLASITIPNFITSIGDEAFRNCTGLTSLSIPNSVTSIGILAFASCTGLTSVTIPNSVTSIGGSAFASCSSLTSITIPDSITSIEEGLLARCSNLTNITIPNSVTSIGKDAFRETKITTLSIPNTVTSLGDAVFYGCMHLTSITIPDFVTNMGDHIFHSCSNLTSVIIGNSVVSIGKYAFNSCTSLVSIISKPMTAPTIISTTFSLYSEISGTLTVPVGSTGYDVWMGTGSYYLGKYNWTKVEQ